MCTVGVEEARLSADRKVFRTVIAWSFVRVVDSRATDSVGGMSVTSGVLEEGASDCVLA